MKQPNMFENDPLDPPLAKAADKVIELREESRTIKERLKIQERNLMGLMVKAKRPKIHHGGKIIEISQIEEKFKLKVTTPKPKKSSRRR